MKRPGDSRRRQACKRHSPGPHARDVRQLPELDVPPLTKEVLDLALQMTRTNGGICGIILSRAGESNAIYPPPWARNENHGPTLEDERS